MLQIQNALGILSSQVPTGNLLWVDQINGVDALATRGRLTIPFKTLTAAKEAAKPGDTIMVLPGTYNENNLLKNGVNWHFFAGAVVTASGAIFSGEGSTIVTGFGDFTATGSVVSIDGNCHFEALRMVAGPAPCIQCEGGEMVVKVAKSITAIADILLLSGGSSRIQVPVISGSNGYSVKVEGGSHQVHAHLIYASADVAICITGGSLVVEAHEINAGSAQAVLHQADMGRLEIKGARVISGTSEAINIVGTDSWPDRLKLNSCLLKGAGSHSIETEDPGPVVQLLGGTCATQDVNTTNITKIGDFETIDSFT